MAQDTIALAPLPPPSGGEAPGTAELADELMRGFAPTPPQPEAPKETPPKETPPAAPPKKDEKAAPAAAPKAGDKPAEPPKPAPAATPAKDLDPDDPKVSAADLRRELKRLKESSTLTVKEREKQIGELTDKISGFEKRRYWTDADLKQHEEATKRLSQLEADLYSRDYAASPEYKSKFQDRLDDIWREASEEVKGLTVKYQDGVDDEQKPIMKERAATTRDLLSVIDAPPVDRMAIAKRLFGDDREPVLQWARDIAVLRRDAAKAIEEKKTGYASEITKRQQQFAEANQKIQGFIQQTTGHLEKQYPNIFSAPADKPELAEKLKTGFAFVDESAAKMMEYDINTRAARAAVVRSMAGAFPRLVLEVSQQAARIKELEEENAKFRQTDPSELGGGTGGGGRTPGEKDGGSDTLAAEIDALNKR